MMRPPGMLFAAAACWAVLARGAAVKSSALALELDDASGRITGVRAANGTDFSAPGACDLFAFDLTRPDDFSAFAHVLPSQAARFSREPLPDGVKFVWEDIAGRLKRVECTMRAGKGDGKVRFGLSLEPSDGWAVTCAEYPRIRLADRIGADASDDRLLTGEAWGGIQHAPGADPTPRRLVARKQPGDLSVQAALWWDASALFCFAAEDDKGDVKQLVVEREKDGISFRWRRLCFDAAPVRLDYDFTMAAVCGTAESPATWYDGAELYREWARTTRFCSVPTAKRKDIPSWLASAPAFTLFERQWFDRPDDMRKWVEAYRANVSKDVPLVAASWGWERYDTWVHPYFPCNPSDEAFASVVSDLATRNVHVYPWPSGYHWTLTYGRRDDGSFIHDWRSDFTNSAAAHACVNRDGKLYERTPGGDWLKGGSMSAMCGGDGWTQRWWSEDVAGELAKRGCRIIQADQNNGGAFPSCWSRAHGHPPGEGRWKTDAARRQMEGMLASIRSVRGEAAAAYEEPNEQMNDLVGIQLLRDARTKVEWASLYGYIYHEYVPVFQPANRPQPLRKMAYAAAMGQLPNLVPDKADIGDGGPAEFGRRRDGSWRGEYMRRWVELFHGEGRPWLAHGRRVKPPRVVCAEVPVAYGKEKATGPAVFVAAYESLDGRRALVLANATDKEQEVRVSSPGSPDRLLRLSPRELLLKVGDW